MFWMVGGGLNCSPVFIVLGSISMLSGKIPNLGLIGPAYFISLAEQKTYCVKTYLLFYSLHAEQGQQVAQFYNLSLNFLMHTGSC